MAGIDVREIPLCSSSPKINEMKRDTRPLVMDDVVELLHHALQLEVARDSHAQAGGDVARLQCRGQPMARRIGDRDAERVAVDVDEVVEIAAHRLCRHAQCRDVEVAEVRPSRAAAG
jgi:hypothetical protein